MRNFNAKFRYYKAEKYIITIPISLNWVGSRDYHVTHTSKKKKKKKLKLEDGFVCLCSPWIRN